MECWKGRLQNWEQSQNDRGLKRRAALNRVSGRKTYDRDLGDVLKLQTEIATSVAGGLRVTLLGDVAAKVELGGRATRLPSIRICAGPRRLARYATPWRRAPDAIPSVPRRWFQ
jgi:hypothetical protein